MKRVCLFGIFKPQYIRNSVLTRGFKENGYEVVHLTVEPSIGSIRKFHALWDAYRRLENKTFDHVIVAYPGHTVVWLARILFGGHIIFDAFLSLYDANVCDRRLYRPWSIRGRRDWLYDWLACRLAWRVLLPERVHVQYFMDTFHLPREKYIQMYTGADNSIFKPLPAVEKAEVCTVHFHGNFIPLQGIEYIIEAAHILRDTPVHFQIVGSGGELYDRIIAQIASLELTNVTLTGRKPLEEVVTLINRAHICLGVFGNTEKTKRVISNKIYECIASGMPLVTARTPATEEIFTDREHVLFANVADGPDLAEKIKLLVEDTALRERIATGGYELFRKCLTPERLVAGLLAEVSR